MAHRQRNSNQRPTIKARFQLSTGGLCLFVGVRTLCASKRLNCCQVYSKWWLLQKGQMLLWSQFQDVNSMIIHHMNYKGGFLRCICDLIHYFNVKFGLWRDYQKLGLPIRTRHVFEKHVCPRRQQNFKIYQNLWFPHFDSVSPARDMWFQGEREQSLDARTVQVVLLYDHPNFKYNCILYVSGTILRTDRQTDGRTDGRSEY